MFRPARAARRKAPSPTRQLLFLMVFLGLFMAPVGASIATAHQADVAQRLLETEDPTEIPLEEILEEAPTEEPYTEPTEVPTEVPGASILVNKAECPTDSFDPYGATESDLANTCTTQSQATFSVTDGDGTTQNGDSGSTFDVPAGQIDISEELPDGYQEPVVVCYSEMSGQNSLPGVSNASISFQIEAGDAVTCTFYNVPEDSNEVTIYKWDCPEGTDPTGTAEYLATECATQHTGIPFDLVDDNGSHPMDSQSDGTTWNDVVRGTEDVTITEEIPDGYGDPVVYCYSLLPDETDPAITTSTGGTVSIPSFTSEPWNYYCNWYNIPGGDGNEVTIYKWDCPEGTDPTGTEEYLLTECNTQHTGIPFDLVDDNGSHPMDSQSDGTTWNDVVASQNPVTISEEIPDGYGDPVVYCWSLLPDETDPAITTSTDGTVTVPTFASEPWNYYCNWFNVPEGDGNEVTVYKWDCPEGTDPTGTLEYLGAECATEHLNIPISLTDDSGAHDTTTQANGTTWNDVVAETGSFSITEEIPDGYGDPVVYCYMLLPDETESSLVTSTGGSITANVPVDVQWNYYCNWYNIPDYGDGNEVTVYKWDCPAGTDPTGTLDYLSAECATEHLNIPISLTDDSGAHDTTTQANGTTWNDVVRGTEDVTITEEIPSGYGDPVVYCYSLLPDETDSTLVTSTGGTVSIPSFASEPWNYYCNWYNIPYYDHQVWVYKWICPDGTVPGDHDEDWFFDNCTEALDGIEYRLDYADGWSYGTTSGGQFVWDFLTPGPIGLQETIPADYDQPVVFCSTDGNTYEQFPVVNGYITYDDFGSGAEGNTAFICHWFNIYGGPGEITVYKWTCPEGYDPYAYGIDPYSDCVEGPNGVTFTAEGPDGYSTQTDTGDSLEYAAYWDGLEPGSYTIEEQVPDGTSSVFVWDCYGQRTGELRPTPLTITPSVELDVHAGEQIICHWFNVPEDPYGTITVIKFECATTTYVSEVDCEIYEGGQTFDLAKWNGSSWDVVATNTTDAYGRYSWYGQEPGEYWLDETGRDWCQMTSEQLSEDGNWLNVAADQETVVKVYNCSGQPGKPGKTPTKYPNTGVPAAIREDWRLTA